MSATFGSNNRGVPFIGHGGSGYWGGGGGWLNPGYAVAPVALLDANVGGVNLAVALGGRRSPEVVLSTGGYPYGYPGYAYNGGPTSWVNSPSYLHSLYAPRPTQGIIPPGTTGYIDASGHFVATQVAANGAINPNQPGQPQANGTNQPNAPLSFQRDSSAVSVDANFVNSGNGANALQLLNAGTVNSPAGPEDNVTRTLGAFHVWHNAMNHAPAADAAGQQADFTKSIGASGPNDTAGVQAAFSNIAATYQAANPADRTKILQAYQGFLQDTQKIDPAQAPRIQEQIGELSHINPNSNGNDFVAELGQMFQEVVKMIKGLADGVDPAHGQGATPPAQDPNQPAPGAAAPTAGVAAHIYGGVHAPKVNDGQVKEIQHRLSVTYGTQMQTSHAADGVDGKWGPKTQAAFEDVCKKNGIDSTKVDLTNANDPNTQKFLAALPPAPAQGPAPTKTTTAPDAGTHGHHHHSAPIQGTAPATPPTTTPKPAQETAAPAAAPAAPTADQWKAQAKLDAAKVSGNVSAAPVTGRSAAGVVSDLQQQLATMGFATDGANFSASIRTVETALSMTPDGQPDLKLKAALDSTDVRADLIRAGVHGGQATAEVQAALNNSGQQRANGQAQAH